MKQTNNNRKYHAIETTDLVNFTVCQSKCLITVLSDKICMLLSESIIDDQLAQRSAEDTCYQ